MNWTEFRKLFTDDLVYSAEGGPRPNPEAPQAISIEGLDIFIGLWDMRRLRRVVG